MSSEPSKTIPPATTAPAWSPDQPLRADATDEQINARSQRLALVIDPAMNFTVLPLLVAREFAQACVAAQRADAEPTPDWMSEDDAGTLLRSLITAGRNKMPLAPIVMEAIRRGGAPASGDPK